MEESYQDLIKEANKALELADHLTYVTYPMVKDIKLLMSITKNLYVSMVGGMEALLNYDRLYKRISPLPESFEAKYEIFRTKVARRYNFERNQVVLIGDLRELIQMHQQSAMVFNRNEKFVITGENYRKIKTLSINDIKDYLSLVKPFLKKISSIVLRNDRIL